MALSASLPPGASVPEEDTTMNDDDTETLDQEIEQVRAEIQALTKHRKLLASTLLSSTKVQTQLSEFQDSSTTNHPDGSAKITRLLETAKHRSQTNVHRLAYGVTSFPFHDPSPEMQSKNPLLGIRFDICADRTGRFDSPYFIFCVKTGGGHRHRNVDQHEHEHHHHQHQHPELKIHRHTIPALVPIEDYEKVYLPLSSDEGSGGTSNSDEDNHRDEVGRARQTGTATQSQDLHGLVTQVRHDLISWRLRQEAVALMRGELELPPGPIVTNVGDDSNDDDDDNSTSHESSNTTGKFGVQDISPIGVDARHIRIIWGDGRVGRLRISDQGKVEKAVVVWTDRLRDQERILMAGNPLLGSPALLECLERVAVWQQ
ncbi:hypothetical protein KCU88_g6039, partial [Aureobasidium melanogenum]